MSKEKFDMNPLYEGMSAMQKYIRRGHAKEAYYFALQVESINPKTLWNRLQEIIIEDLGDPVIIPTFEIIRNWYFQKMDKGKHGHLELSYVIVMMTNARHSRDSVNLLKTVDWGIEFEAMELPIPDFAFDRHTLRGKKMGRGWKHFFDEAIKMINDESIQEWKEECERLVSKFPRPSGGCKQVQRAIASYANMKGKQTMKPTAQVGLDNFTEDEDDE